MYNTILLNTKHCKYVKYIFGGIMNTVFYSVNMLISSMVNMFFHCFNSFFLWLKTKIFIKSIVFIITGFFLGKFRTSTSFERL